MKKVFFGTLLALFFPVIASAQMGGGMMGGGMMGPGQGRGYNEQPSQMQGQGAEIYRMECYRCHGQGGNLVYPSLPLRGAPQLADFNTFLEYIRHPTMPDGSQGPMPAFSAEKISDDQARDLHQYLIAVLRGPAQGGPGSGYGIGPGMGYGMGPGTMGRGYEMGPGMGRGYGMGPGMMGRGYGGYGMGPGQGRGYRGHYQQLSKPLNKEQARQEVENYLNSTRNPNLKVGKIEEKGNQYEVDVVTKEGALVDKILIDKSTGRMRSAYEQGEQ